MQLSRDTCARCCRQNNRLIYGNLSLEAAHVVPKHFCKDATHFEALAILLCRPCHMEFEDGQRDIINHWFNLSHHQIELNLIDFAFRWLTRREPCG